MNVLIAGLLLTCLSGPVPNAEEEPGRIRAEIQVIHATRGKPMIDTRLKKLSRYLTRAFGNHYQSFKQLGSTRPMVLSKGMKRTRKLPNTTTLALTYMGKSDSLLRLALDVGGLSTTVKIHDGGLFFQAGRKHQGGMLIVAIRVSAHP